MLFNEKERFYQVLFSVKVKQVKEMRRKDVQADLFSKIKKLGDGNWARARRECGILTNYRLQSEKSETIRG